MDQLTVLDLFSGIGGMSLGLEHTGFFKAVAFAEQNRFCQSVLRKHWPGVPIFDDVREVNYGGTVDVITSGDPCQRDSRANTGRDGATLWPLTLEHIRKHRPVYVIRENVAGNIETGTLRRVENDLRDEGYKVRTYALLAVCFGANHHRRRTWTLAYTDRAGQQELDNAAKPRTQKRWQHSMFAGAHGVYWMGSESPVLRRVDDVPNRLDRIKALGNAVIPAIPYQIGLAISEIEFGRDRT